MFISLPRWVEINVLLLTKTLIHKTCPNFSHLPSTWRNNWNLLLHPLYAGYFILGQLTLFLGLHLWESIGSHQEKYNSCIPGLKNKILLILSTLSTPNKTHIVYSEWCSIATTIQQKYQMLLAISWILMSITLAQTNIGE